MAVICAFGKYSAYLALIKPKYPVGVSEVVDWSVLGRGPFKTTGVLVVDGRRRGGRPPGPDEEGVIVDGLGGRGGGRGADGLGGRGGGTLDEEDEEVMAVCGFVGGRGQQ